jgi:exosortase/archaeosortase family protein
MNRSRHGYRNNPGARNAKNRRVDPVAAMLRAWYTSKGPVLKFGLKFGVLMAVYYILALTPVCDRLIYAYLSANAWLGNAILNVLGEHSSVTEITIRSARFAITVRRGCDAIEPAWFFCAAVLSFPGPAWPKALISLAGIILLQVLNLIRIISLYFIGIHYPSFFRTAHVEIWPVFFVGTAIFLWLGWISWVGRHARLNSYVAS